MGCRGTLAFTSTNGIPSANRSELRLSRRAKVPTGRSSQADRHMQFTSACCLNSLVSCELANEPGSLLICLQIPCVKCPPPLLCSHLEAKYNGARVDIEEVGS